MAQSKRVTHRAYADFARPRRVVVCEGGVAWARPDAVDFLVTGVAAAFGTEVGLAFAAFALALVTFGVVAPRDLDEAGFAAFVATSAFLPDLGADVFATLEGAPGSALWDFFGAFAAFAGLTGRAFSGATLTLAEVRNVSRTLLTGVAACRVVFVSTIFAAFADVPRGADVRRVSGCLEAATARLCDAVAGVEAFTRLDRLRVFTVAAGKSHNDTCATFALFALCGVDGMSLVALDFEEAGRPMGFSALDCTIFFALTGRATAATVALVVLLAVFCLDGFRFAVILAVGFVARAFGFNALMSAAGAGGAGIFGALAARARVGGGADIGSSCVCGVTLALDVRLLRGFGVWPSGFASTLATADAADLAAGAR